MKAVGYQKSLPIDQPQSLVDIELPEPTPGPHDLLVEVRAVSVNPVDAKVRMRAEPPAWEYKVLGYDAAGVVRAVGSAVTLFRPGDEVYYAGSIDRSGTNAELHLVHEAIVGRKPASLSFADAAALPLTTITAWELLFDRLQVPRDKNAKPTVLVIGGAGGVGSVLLQLAGHLTGATIVATASRPETRDWCLSLGAHHVLDHSKPLAEQVSAAGLGPIDYVASLTQTGSHWKAICEVLRPQGRVGLIDDPPTLDALPLKRKAASLHWEFMFARPVFQTPDMIEQHHLLDAVSGMIDAGSLRTTLGEHFGTINAANLKRAHALLESGKAKGKIVLEGF